MKILASNQCVLDYLDENKMVKLKFKKFISNLEWLNYFSYATI